MLWTLAGLSAADMNDNAGDDLNVVLYGNMLLVIENGDGLTNQW